MSDFLNAALKYVSCGGHAVLPLHTPSTAGCSCGKAECPSPGKHPRTTHGIKEATSDEAIIRNWSQRWPDANIGIATGKSSGIVVLDIDPRHGGDQSLTRLQGEYGDLPRSPIALTGGGGWHVYFECPVDSIPSSTNIVPGIDIRGEGGYVTAPPSLHVSGRRYQWSQSNDCVPAPLPTWLRQLIAKPSDSLNQATEPQNSDRVIPEGERNSRLTRIAGSLRRQGLSVTLILDLLKQINQKDFDPPLPNEEVLKIAESIGRYPPAVVSKHLTEVESHGLQENEPSPPDNTPSSVEQKTLLLQIEDFIRRFVVLPQEPLLPVALWAMATHVFDIFQAFPYLALTSPAKQCGKTLLTEVLELLVSKPARTVGISEAALFRSIEANKPTLILDEAEFLSSRSERAEAMRALLNAGNRPGATVPRCVGNTHEVVNFSLFSPKILCAIGPIPDTIRDRSIVIEMQRRQKRENVERFLRRKIQADAAGLRQCIAAFARTQANEIRAVYERMELEQTIPVLTDRDIEAWEPLFALIDVVDNSRVAELRNSAEKLACQKYRTDEEESLGLNLLSIIRDTWPTGRNAIFTRDLIVNVQRPEESPFHRESSSQIRYEGGKIHTTAPASQTPTVELSSRKLAMLLRPFKIESRQVRVGDRTGKGYHLGDLQDAFSRYLGPKKETSETSAWNSALR